MTSSERLSTRYGAMKVPSWQDLIGASLRHYGEWAQTEIDVMRRFISPGDTVLDIGAYIGTHSRAFSHFVSDEGRVLSFEPQFEIFEILSENVALAPLANLTAYQFALGPHEGIAELQVRDWSNLGATVVRFSAHPELHIDDSRVSVPVRRIDDLGIEHINFIKLDVEGEELRVLQGGHDCILRDKPIIAMEMNSIDAASGIFDFCVKYGYKCFGSVAASHNPNNYNGTSKILFNSGAAECGVIVISAGATQQLEWAENELCLPVLETLDDLALVLLQKPQYPSEILSLSRAGRRLPVPIIAFAPAQQPSDADDSECNVDAPSMPSDDAVGRVGELVDKDEIIASQAAQIREEQERQAALAEEIAHLRNTLHHRDAQIRQRDAAVEDLGLRLAKVTQSLAWRCAAPFRWRSAMRSREEMQVPKEVQILEGEQDKESHVFIERAYCRGQALEVEGWFFSENSRTLSASLMVRAHRFAQQFSVRTGIERVDVLVDRGHPLGLHSGFLATCLLDPAAGNADTVDIEFTLEGRSKPVVYSCKIAHEPFSRVRVARHVIRRLNTRRLKVGLDDIVRGRIDSLWLRMNHIFQHRHVQRSDLIRATDLSQALDLISIAPEPCPPLVGPVDIIIPAYKCLQYLDPLFESLERNTDPIHRVILVDNGNEDPAMVERLRRFSEERPNVTLIRLEENQGFVGAVNRAAEQAQYDFVLLNTDVIVPPQWLERLFAPFATDAAIASVTPFSNAATVCSFPTFCVDNSIYGDFSTDEIDQWFRHVRTEKIEKGLPSGVGFCMAIRHSIWQEIGMLDEVAFRRGYGEENDWCLRAQAKGYTNVIATNLFCYHKHGGTFESATRAELRKASLDEVIRRFPSYPADVEHYIRRDPLRPLREILSIIIACRQAQLPSYLIIDHKIGGGANHYRSNRIRELVESGSPVLTALINAGANPELGEDLFLLEFSFRDLIIKINARDITDIENLLKHAGISNIIVNNTVSSTKPSHIVSNVCRLKKTLGAHLSIPIHDYYALCPSYTLIGSDQRYCGLPAGAGCESCLPSNGYAVNPEQSAIAQWRFRWGQLLRLADEILCFSNDSRDHVLKVYPDLASRIVVRPHQLNVHFDHLPETKKGGSLNIGVVGAIGPQKGSEVLNDLASVMLKRDPSAVITVIGEINKNSRKSNLIVTGKYAPADLPLLIDRKKISVFLFPSIWPETFSYVVEELMQMDLPLAVFDLGAPAERVRKYPKGRVLDLRLAQEPERLYEALAEFAREQA